MAVRQFAIPLNDESLQTGDITFEKLDDNNSPVEFKLSNVTASGGTNELNLVTKKSGSTKDHKFQITYSTGMSIYAHTTLTAAQIHDVMIDAEDGNWDYVEARWTVGSTDTPTTSVMTLTQNSVVYDYTGWPPKQPS